MMRGKIQTQHSCISQDIKSWVLTRLQHGDKSQVAKLLGVSPDYVKDVYSRRDGASSVLSQRIWLAGYRLLKKREELAEEFKAESTPA
jgi:hypothetical protein